MTKKGNIDELLELEGITPEEFEATLEVIRHPKKAMYNTHNADLNAKKFTFGIISDSHMGAKVYRPDILADAIKEFDKYHVEFVVHAGDILEGMSGRDGHIYELNHIGASKQLDYASEELSKIKQPIYAITASQSHDGWYSSKFNAGLEVGPELERRIPNFKFLGYDEADLQLDNGCLIRLNHPGDGTAYAISYKLQKYINSLSGGKKPNILVEGHYHKAMYMFNRNIHAFEAGCLCEQSIFMRKKMTPAMMGYWMVKVQMNAPTWARAVDPMFRGYYE